MSSTKVYQSNFFCNLCKLTKRIYLRKVILFINPYTAAMWKADCCAECELKLKIACNTKEIPKNIKQTMLDKWGIEI